ncbi:MAG: hypothetical protein R3C14_40580 [Caldilineaceae bacterium]
MRTYLQGFWPSFFLFLFALLLLFALTQPALLFAALTFIGAMTVILFWLLIGAACFAGLLVATLVWRRFNLNARRPVDGAFPLQHFRLKGGRRLLLNPNHMIGHATIIDPSAGAEEQPHAAGWDILARIRLAIERTNSLRAIFPGDNTRQTRNGALSEMPKLNGQGWKVLDPTVRVAHANSPKLAAKELSPLPITSPITTSDQRAQACAAPTASSQPPPADPLRSLQRATPTTLTAGQSIHTGQLVYWNLLHQPHARIHGSSQGAGKSNLAATFLVGAVLQGHHVLILDRRRFKNFRAFQGHAELVDTTNPAQFVATLQRLEELYTQRDQLLGQHGAADITELPHPPARYIALITEFGTLCSYAHAEGILSDALTPLKRIMAEAAATGVHLIFEDQVPERDRWPRGVAANAAAVFTGHLPEHSGQLGGYHAAHKLPPYHFHHASDIFRTFDMRTVAPQLLATVPNLDLGTVTIDGQATVHPAATNAHKPAIRQQRAQARDAPPPASAAPRSPTSQQRAQARDAPPASSTRAPRAPDSAAAQPPKWYAFVKAYMAKHPGLYQDPPQGVRALARAMAQYELDDPAEHARYVGVASTLCRQIRAEQAGSPLDTPDALSARERLQRAGINLADVTINGHPFGQDITHDIQGDEPCPSC